MKVELEENVIKLVDLAETIDDLHRKLAETEVQVEHSSTKNELLAGPNSKLMDELESHQHKVNDLHELLNSIHAEKEAKRIKAKNLQLLLTAGIGSDHLDLKEAADAGLIVAKVTGSNVVLVAEDELMRILLLVHNFLLDHLQVFKREWDFAAMAYIAYDLEGTTIGTVGVGRIGKLLLHHLKPFLCNLLYHDRLKMESELAQQIGAKFQDEMLSTSAADRAIEAYDPISDSAEGIAKITETDTELLHQMAIDSGAILNPMAAILGGPVGKEVVR